MFPGSLLPLQIFEQRYLNLIKECMKQQTGFVTVLISEGKEVGGTPQIYRIGCYGDILDWDALPNGLLGIKIQAKQRVRLSNSSVKDDGLLLAEANPIKSTLENKPPLPEAFKPLLETLKQLLNHPFAAQYKDQVDFTNTLNEEEDFSRSFSFYDDFDSQTSNLTAAEDQLIETIFDQIIFDIFNTKRVKPAKSTCSPHKTYADGKKQYSDTPPKRTV